MKRLITTPIFYVNASPHLGHAYSALLADALKRWLLIAGDGPASFSPTTQPPSARIPGLKSSLSTFPGVLLSTGTDEHGTKIADAASAQKKSPAEFCDGISREFKDCFDVLGVGYDDYIRTTESRH
jgi:methionyl-tRNA synthetase